MSTAARFALLTALFAVGCGRPPARSYYTLTYPAERGDFATPHDVTIRVREVDLRESYRRTELVFRPDVHEIRYDRRQRWSERPQKMITSLVTDHLRASGLVSRVTDAVGQIAPDYTLAGEVEAIEQVVAGDTAYARLAMNWRLLRAKDDAVVWTWRFDRREPVGKPDQPGTVRATVRTLSALLDREFDRALVDL
ncbi:MAG: membrane integrity-associated transporter subunit PqiC, partial [Myxococcales bacterium]|nr:membrane integrity-associated transporter subunit PqiC [Myxococcales bacterium]